MPGSAEQLLISKLITEHTLQPVIDANLRPDHFIAGDWAEVFEWVHGYWREHQEVPTERAFHTMFPEIKVLDASEEPFSGLIEEVIYRYDENKTTQMLSEAWVAAERDGPKATRIMLAQRLQEIRTETSRIRDVDLISEWALDLQRYEELRHQVNVLNGIPTGFAGLDRITAGLRPQQLITFVGEPKKGKSMIALIMAMAAHLHNRKPHFVSFEMSIEEQKARYHALASKVAYERILRYDLSPKDMEALRKAELRYRNMNEFVMSEDTTSLTTVGALAGKIQETRPDVLFVDGVYLMDDELGEPKGSPQALTNITRSLKRVAQHYRIPIVITTQVLAWKLNSKSTRKVTADAIGYSSSFAQDSDLVLAVEEDPDVPGQSIIRVVIARAAPHGKVHIRWDWDHMDFSEVTDDDDDDASYDDYEYV